MSKRMTARQARAAMQAMCDKCPGYAYNPAPGDVPHCGFTCESTIGYEDIIAEEFGKKAELQQKLEGVDR